METCILLTEDSDVGDVERLSLANGVLENARVSALIASGGVLDEQGGLQGRTTLVVLPAVEHHRRSVSQPETHKIALALVSCQLHRYTWKHNIMKLEFVLSKINS